MVKQCSAASAKNFQTHNMQSRRQFLQETISLLAMLAVPSLPARAALPEVFQGEDVFNRILAKATKENWRALPIGELMGKIAKELEGTPYKSNTLELSSATEICSANLAALDCVTFFETTLDMARMIKNGGHIPTDLLKEIRFTRYRGGMLGDYTTRLHYTSDWFADNETKHVVQILSQLPGTEAFVQKVNYMSQHPEGSIQLKANPALLTKIRQSERAINARSMKFIPLNKIAAIESQLKTGDIVGICTSMPGLDIAHTGIVFRTDDGVAHFMDASSRKSAMKVTIEPGTISDALGSAKNCTGAMFARPLEPAI